MCSRKNFWLSIRWLLVKQIIKVDGNQCVPQGGPFRPRAANFYLNEVDWYDVDKYFLGKKIIFDEG